MKYKSLIAALFIPLFLYVAVFAQSAITGTVTKGVNLRTGPGMTYAVVGVLKAGQSVTIVGKSTDGAWSHLSDGHWIATFLVKVVGTATPFASSTVTGTRPTSTPSATFTITPTSTKPPLPTKTPIPTAVPTQIDYINDPVAKAYTLGAQKVFSMSGQSANLLSARFSEAGDNPYVILDDAWITDVAVALGGLKAAAAMIRQLDPPPYLADIQKDLLQLADHLEKAVDLLAAGVDNKSADQITAGSKELSLATQSTQSAKEKVSAFLADNAEQASTSTPTTVATPVTVASCDPSYPDFCIAPAPPDLDCTDVHRTNFTVLAPDPHSFDIDHDGIGCES